MCFLLPRTTTDIQSVWVLCCARKFINTSDHVKIIYQLLALRLTGGHLVYTGAYINFIGMVTHISNHHRRRKDFRGFTIPQLFHVSGINLHVADTHIIQLQIHKPSTLPTRPFGRFIVFMRYMVSVCTVPGARSFSALSKSSKLDSAYIVWCHYKTVLWSSFIPFICLPGSLCVLISCGLQIRCNI